MLKILLLLSLFIFSSASVASTEWEYQVIFLPGTTAGAKVVKQQHGGYLDSTKTNILNKLAKKGWEIISVTGQSGADHAVYLRRQITKNGDRFIF